MNRWLLTFPILAAISCGLPPSPPASSPIPEKPAKLPKLAPDKSVFGVITMSQPLALPACKDAYAKEIAPCRGGIAPDGIDVSVVVPALNESFIFSPVVEVREIDGIAHIATVRSLSAYDAPEEMLAELTKKYGQPDYVDDRRRATYASWDFDDLTVSWSAPQGEVDHATAFIKTPEGEAQFNREARERDARIPQI